MVRGGICQLLLFKDMIHVVYKGFWNLEAHEYPNERRYNTLWKAFLCPECSLYTIAHQLAKVWALLYMLGVALGAMSPSGNTKVLSLLAIAQRLEARWPDSEGQRFDSRKSWSAKPWTENRTVPTSCRPTTTTYVANRSGPLSLCTTVQTLRELWPIWHFRGPSLLGPALWKAFLCPECSLYTIAH